MASVAWEFWLANYVTGTASASFGFSEAATATETVTGTAAAAFGFAAAASGTELFTATEAESFAFSIAATGGETFAGIADTSFGFSTTADGTVGVAPVVLLASGGSRRVPQRMPRPRATELVVVVGAGGSTFAFTSFLSGSVDDDELTLALAA